MRENDFTDKIEVPKSDSQEYRNARNLVLSLGKGNTDFATIMEETKKIKNEKLRSWILNEMFDKGYSNYDDMMKELKTWTDEYEKSTLLAQMIYYRFYKDFDAIMEEIKSWKNLDCKERVLLLALINNFFHPIMKEIRKWQDKADIEGIKHYNGNVYFDAIMEEVKTWTDEDYKTTILLAMIDKGYTNFETITEEIKTWKNKSKKDAIIAKMLEFGYAGFELTGNGDTTQRLKK